MLPEPLLKNLNVNCPLFERNTRKPYNDNLCLLRKLALRLHGNHKLEEETAKISNLFLTKSEGGDAPKFQGVQMKGIPKIEDILLVNIFLCGIVFVDGELIGELARRSIQKHDQNVFRRYGKL